MSPFEDVRLHIDHDDVVTAPEPESFATRSVFGSSPEEERKAEQECEVLIVDDDPDIRDSLCCLLTDLGLSVQEAADGREALRRLSALCPLVVMLDMSMPGVAGEDLIEAIRSSPGLSRIPVIRMTGRDGVPPPALFKPFSLDHVVDQLAPYVPRLRGS